MKLYGYWRSSSAWRVRIALLHKGLPFDNQPVHLVRDGGEQHGAGYRAVNPMAEVPTLEMQEGGADPADQPVAGHHRLPRAAGARRRR